MKPVNAITLNLYIVPFVFQVKQQYVAITTEKSQYSKQCELYKTHFMDNKVWPTVTL